MIVPGRGADLGEQPEQAAFAVEEIADIHRGGLKFDERGRKEGGSSRASHLLCGVLTDFRRRRLRENIPRISRQVVPLIEMALRFRKAARVEQLPDSTRPRGKLRGFVRVTVP